MSFGEKVKYVREKLLFTQIEMSEELNVTPLTVIRWEQGKVEPHFKSRKVFRDFCAKHEIKFEED